MVAIIDAAQALSNAHKVTTIRAEAQKKEIADAIAPIIARHRPGLEAAALEEKSLFADLLKLITDSPQLFVRPRSVSVDGVKSGYRKEEDTLDWDSDEAVVARIYKLLPPEVHAVLIRTTETLVHEALQQLPPEDQQKIGVRRVSGVDAPFVSVGDTDTDRLVKAILSDIAKRVGEDEPAPKKKAKAKAGAAA